MRAVLWDMDGTLVDSEKLWDVAMGALYEHLGGVLTAEVRAATIGAATDDTMRLVYDDLGLPADPAAMANTAEWLLDFAGRLFEADLPWRDGAETLLRRVAARDIPMALVTNTPRALAERALSSIGRGHFTAVICGDEVPRGKPAPDPYRRAAQLLGVSPAECLAVEDSPTGAAAADAAGCPVLVVPSAVPVPTGVGRHIVATLAGLDVDDLRGIHTGLAIPGPV